MTDKSGQVLVAGSINMDIVATVLHHPIPGQTIPGTNLSYFPGGKGANQAVAAARAGAAVTMIGAVGDDAFGPELLNFLRANGMNIDGVHNARDVSSGIALIVVDSAGENSIVVVPGANGRVDSDLVASSTSPNAGDVLVAQFETPLDATEEFFALGRAQGAKCVLNPAPANSVPASLLRQVDFLVVNETELAVVSKLPRIDAPTTEEVHQAYRALGTMGFNGCLIATLGARGAVTVADGAMIETPGRAVSVVDTTGAGDCFVGYLAAALSEDRQLDQALIFANAAASLCVQAAGAGPSMPLRADVDAVLHAVR